MKVESIAYFFTLLILFVKPGPSEGSILSSKLLKWVAGTKIANWVVQKYVQFDLAHDPIWEKKYGDMSKIYIKIFKRRKSLWPQKFNLKKDGKKIVEALEENGFDPDLETKIITHGYIDNGIIFLNSFAGAYENRGKNIKKFAHGLDFHITHKSIKNFLYQFLKKICIFLILGAIHKLCRIKISNF